MTSNFKAAFISLLISQVKDRALKMRISHCKNFYFAPTAYLLSLTYQIIRNSFRSPSKICLGLYSRLYNLDFLHEHYKQGLFVKAML